MREAVNFRIVGRKLPGIKFGPSQGAYVERKPVYLGIQKKKEVVNLVAGNARRAIFDFPVDVIFENHSVDYRGPFVHGKKGDRFLYLSWGELEDEKFTMFRRAKLHLSGINRSELKQSIGEPKHFVEVIVDLTDQKGGPVCGSIADLRWRIHSNKDTLSSH
jgi:hypothetical protein